MYNIGVIIGSTRSPRCAPQFTEFIVNHIKKTISKDILNDVDFNIIDLKEQNLPMYNESKIPRLIKDFTEYDHEHTKEWSKLINKQDGYIFVAPQYNWSIPSALKNAIEYLSHEWVGKSAMIVTYASNGGQYCNEHLQTVCKGGLMMKTLKKNVMLPFPDRQTQFIASTGANIEMEESGMFKDFYSDIEESFMEFYSTLTGKETDEIIDNLKKI